MKGRIPRHPRPLFCHPRESGDPEPGHRDSFALDSLVIMLDVGQRERLNIFSPGLVDNFNCFSKIGRVAPWAISAPPVDLPSVIKHYSLPPVAVARQWLE